MSRRATPLRIDLCYAPVTAGQAPQAPQRATPCYPTVIRCVPMRSRLAGAIVMSPSGCTGAHPDLLLIGRAKLDYNEAVSASVSEEYAFAVRVITQLTWSTNTPCESPDRSPPGGSASLYEEY